MWGEILKARGERERWLNRERNGALKTAIKEVIGPLKVGKPKATGNLLDWLWLRIVYVCVFLFHFSFRKFSLE